MSLLATASTWNSDSKKRVSTLRKKNKKEYDDSDELEHLENPSHVIEKNTSIEGMKTSGEERTNRVNDLLNKMNEENEDEDGLGNFEPIKPPGLNIKKDMEKVKKSKEYVAPQYSYEAGSSALRKNSISNNINKEAFSNYSKSYDAPKAVEPYYAKMGLSGGSQNDKLMEKMNYLIHMMEENQAEKTNNITEEFILYLFLGVFIIFVVDSFNKTKKYVR